MTKKSQLNKCKRTIKWKSRRTRRLNNKIKIKLSCMSASEYTPGEIKRNKIRKFLLQTGNFIDLRQ